MRLLLDTHLVLWLASEPHRLPAAVVDMIEEVENEVICSVASLWEIAIKNALGRPEFSVDLPRLRHRLAANGYRELSVVGEHALALQELPTLHKDPFDRILVAQAIADSLTLLTSDAMLARYGEPVRRV